MKISRYFDAAVLKSEMTPQQVEEAIREAIAWDSYSVCVRGCDIDLALELTRSTNTSVGCVLDFPTATAGWKPSAWQPGPMPQRRKTSIWS